MASDLQLLDILSSNLSQLKNHEELLDKCQVLIDTIRKIGWERVTLSFINGKYETQKTIYSGFPEDMIKVAETKTLSSQKRKLLLSSAVDRWRITVFTYLPWRDERARTLVSGGKTTAIPIESKNQWHARDLLYAPVYYKSRPVAVLTLDSPRDGQVPNRINLRGPQIVHSCITEVILEFVSEEYFAHSQKIRKAIMDKGTIGIITLSESAGIIDMNHATEIILKLNKKEYLKRTLFKALQPEFVNRIKPVYDQASKDLQSQEVQATYTYEDGGTRQFVVQLFPLSVMYDYSGMICLLNLPESDDIHQQYTLTLRKLASMSSDIKGDFSTIQRTIIKQFCREFNFSYPRIYRLSNDRMTMECILSFDEKTQNLSFFDHPYNRNSVAASALIDDEIIFTTQKHPTIRDVRRIWQYLDTRGTIAIPVHVSENITAILVCDINGNDFQMDMSREIIFNFVATIIGLTLRPYFRVK